LQASSPHELIFSEVSGFRLCNQI